MEKLVGRKDDDDTSPSGAGKAGTSFNRGSGNNLGSPTNLGSRIQPMVAAVDRPDSAHCASSDGMDRCQQQHRSASENLNRK